VDPTIIIKTRLLNGGRYTSSSRRKTIRPVGFESMAMLNCKNMRNTYGRTAKMRRGRVTRQCSENRAGNRELNSGQTSYRPHRPQAPSQEEIKTRPGGHGVVIESPPTRHRRVSSEFKQQFPRLPAANLLHFQVSSHLVSSARMIGCHVIVHSLLSGVVFTRDAEPCKCQSTSDGFCHA
jgi:hypothetical protein